MRGSRSFQPLTTHQEPPREEQAGDSKDPYGDPQSPPKPQAGQRCRRATGASQHNDNNYTASPA